MGACCRLSTAVKEAELTRILAALTPAGRDGIRHPDPYVLTVWNTRPLLDEAVRISARFGGGWLVGETLAAGLAYGHELYFGHQANVGPIIIRAARDLGKSRWSGDPRAPASAAHATYRSACGCRRVSSHAAISAESKRTSLPTFR